MKKGIVLKLFLLTTALCTLILAIIFIGQTLFFKQYYENRKVNDVKASIQTFENEYKKNESDTPAIRKMEENFYLHHTSWITTLDSSGNIKNAKDFFLEIQLDSSSQNNEFSGRLIQIPLYSFIALEDVERVAFFLEQGNRIIIDGAQQGNTILPAILTIEKENVVLENRQISELFYGKQTSRASGSPLYLTGHITNVQLPEQMVGANFIYANHVLIDRIKQFQVDLITNDSSHHFDSTEIMDFKENGVSYKIIVKPIKDSKGEINYIFTLTSLQPVDEAVQMIKDYYVYLIIFVFLLIVLVSLYYSKKIAQPLLQINKTTEKIADLDFSEMIPVTTNDEIGHLSQNINILSKTLHSYIVELQQDIEKEKQLENTRKEFIAGVSHELKTPLSIMKSCISILEDGVASNKKEYYFQAMAKEIDRMDRLIIDMLELAKFESGTYRMDMDIFYMDEIIEYIIDQLSVDISKKQLHVHQSLSTIQVVANQPRIEQVLTNFISNAIRYTPEKKDIFVSMVVEEEHVKICIENKGAHIAPDHLVRIWDRFYRGDISRQQAKEGTGLGLAISKNILELHGVPYGVTNTKDGVLFYFSLKKSV
ncbi:HAMP domain-containing sensor histidine kinase [Lysinibacillus fusiformis]|uniref:sensor histidine kinase n=1 Tax=Lysinibacillus fusiformis TaxID=28031 RepID=UPI002D772552|nr:HAMP domain-containing sensor histidine kinase [Lysinibacillus fusiformis]WRS96625.1 HAMP domain-containing sensor histidine kinase [Lysinibacillus fusiformis]